MRFFPEDVRETAWLSEQDEKNNPENTRPLSALLRIEILHSCSVATWCTETREGPLSTHLLHLLLTLKQIYCSHASCQLTDVYFEKSGSNNPSVSERLVWGRRQRKLWPVSVCMCMCQQQVWFSPLFSWNIYFTQGMQYMSCMLTLRGRRKQKHVTIWGHMRVNRFQEVRHKWSFGHSTVTTNKFRLYSCRAHSLGCCKTLALGLIKTLITERTGQLAA